MDSIEKGFQLKLALFCIILISPLVNAQTTWESYVSYDKCQVNVPVCQQAAKQGDIQSQYNLGKMYYTGEGVQQDYHMAKKLWEQASEKGNPQAQNGLGVLYYSNKGVQTRNIDFARNLFLQAALQGEYKALLNLGKMYDDKHATDQDLKKAAEGFRKFRDEDKKQLEQQSNSGNADASYKLSRMYTDDEVLKSDLNQKIYYLEKAAKQGSASAQYEIGYIYYRGGYGLRSDPEKGRDYFIQAYNQGNSDAAYSLYEYYTYRDEPNTEKALKYLQKAAEQRHFRAIHQIAYYYYHGVEPYLKQDYKKAFQFYEILSTTLSNRAKYYLGNDYQLAAMYQLGIMYENGQGITKSREKALELFKTSCDGGYQKSCDVLNNKR
ncbi:tetratricopeptide repeat protein [Leminorella grimontii]|uniref:tetratricopeptide repeat protein n=1 Tax=Leminorella grimontii TaxID=82981 RepID=UPI00322035FF